MKKIESLQAGWRVFGMVRGILKRGQLTDADRDAFFGDKGVAEILRMERRRRKKQRKKSTKAPAKPKKRGK